MENFVQVNVGQFSSFFCGGGGGRGGSMRCHGIRAWGRRTNCRWGESMEATWIRVCARCFVFCMGLVESRKSFGNLQSPRVNL